MWKYLYIDDPSEAYAIGSEIQDMWQALILESRNQNVSVFSRKESEETGIHYYFPPNAETIAIQFNAKEIEKPTKSEAGKLHCGDQRFASILFD